MDYLSCLSMIIDIAEVGLDEDGVDHATLDHADEWMIVARVAENGQLLHVVRHDGRELLLLDLFLRDQLKAELMLARAVATSVVAPKDEDESSNSEIEQEFSDDEILKDWFDTNG